MKEQIKQMKQMKQMKTVINRHNKMQKIEGQCCILDEEKTFPFAGLTNF